jgi:hypothetical protein
MLGFIWRFCCCSICCRCCIILCCWAIACACAAVGAGKCCAGIIWGTPLLFTIMAPAICWPAIMPGGGLAWVMRGVGTTCGLVMGVACATLGVALGILGVPAAWLCWLPRADMLTAMGTAMP